jgi:hypothetical protein
MFSLRTYCSLMVTILFIIASVETIYIDEPTITIIPQKQFSLQTDDKKAVAIALKTNTELLAIGTDTFDSMINQIMLSGKLDGAKTHILKWKFEITPTIGTLKIIDVYALVSGNQIDIKMNTGMIAVNIQQQYDSVEKCERSGRRKYRIAGPRKEECYTHQIPRGLYPHEIEQINKVLLAKVPSVMKLL